MYIKDQVCMCVGEITVSGISENLSQRNFFVVLIRASMCLSLLFKYLRIRSVCGHNDVDSKKLR